MSVNCEALQSTNVVPFALVYVWMTRGIKHALNILVAGALVISEMMTTGLVRKQPPTDKEA